MPSAACHSPAHAKENHFASMCVCIISRVLGFFLLESERKEEFEALGHLDPHSSFKLLSGSTKFLVIIKTGI